MINEHIILARRPGSNGPLWRRKAYSESGFEEQRVGRCNWIQLAEDMVEWWTHLNTTMAVKV
jgi:hypothetical protein